MNLFDVAAALIGLTALFAWLNQRTLRLPTTIAMLTMGLIASVLVIGVEELTPGLPLLNTLRSLTEQIDLYQTIMHGMLCFLLFAGALHVDIADLREARWSIVLLATGGVVMSTFMVGLGMWGALDVLGIALPLAWAMVFGALISPTDPVAVLGILKQVKVPRELEARIAGESLFNDGVAVVVFSVALTVATQGGGVQAGEIARIFGIEAGGGALMGGIAAWVVSRGLAGMDDHEVVVLATLALVMVLYAIAEAIGVSGPIAVVVAGLVIGNHGLRRTISEVARDHVVKFWDLIDGILNAVLFLLLGLEVLVLWLDLEALEAGLIAIPVTLAARWASVWLPITGLSLVRALPAGTIRVLTWGGLRGGISVALALSLPEGAVKDIILGATYGVVLFSVIIQGLTVKAVVRRVIR